MEKQVTNSPLEVGLLDLDMTVPYPLRGQSSRQKQLMETAF
jgi:hypothetical protein